MRGSVGMIGYQHKQELISRLISERGRLVARVSDQGLYVLEPDLRAQVQ
jgi:hypothetical protein